MYNKLGIKKIFNKMLINKLYTFTIGRKKTHITNTINFLLPIPTVTVGRAFACYNSKLEDNKANKRLQKVNKSIRASKKKFLSKKNNYILEQLN